MRVGPYRHRCVFGRNLEPPYSPRRTPGSVRLLFENLRRAIGGSRVNRSASFIGFKRLVCIARKRRCSPPDTARLRLRPACNSTSRYFAASGSAVGIEIAPPRSEVAMAGDALRPSASTEGIAAGSIGAMRGLRASAASI